ncbi:hypothetical protein CC1G_08252 [Coprinopsis cinerea okayama7|uniref:F-box domain-containing protein n=1 Tax=Coprinopsis cinerea (strain Okayama-7 / 130 / ATCC MYA-4618 / FGSC 9003) TaxID=240176 RepID=A8P7L0_COPC7|nr:hypothetical protein CC1G_08252 [Coprinopsis cinerea okayama7\|eukprot:XP_001839385.2 hypothetical protein CC1G_08252 [Coprinopsis cinerea okayama7\
MLYDVAWIHHLPGDNGHQAKPSLKSEYKRECNSPCSTEVTSLMDRPLQIRTPLASLPVELFLLIASFANVVHPYGITVFEVMRLAQVSRRFYNVLYAAPTFWTLVAFSVQSSFDVDPLLNGMSRAIENSVDLPLHLSLEIDTLLGETGLSQILRHIFLSGSRWQEMLLEFRENWAPAWHVQRWFTELWILTEASGGISPFINLQELAISLDSTMAWGSHGQVYNATFWFLHQLFPNLRTLHLHDLEFQLFYRLPAQLAIPTLEVFHLTSARLRDVPFLIVRDILAHSPRLTELVLYVGHIVTTYMDVVAMRTVTNTQPHTSLRRLFLSQSLEFMAHQLRALNCPSLSYLDLDHYPHASPQLGGTTDLVEAILTMVSQSGCELETLILGCPDLSNEDFVRLFLGLPHLKHIDIFLRDVGGVNDNLFATLLQRSANDSVLPRLERLKVTTHSHTYTFPTQAFVAFVNDPQRSGNGPFSHLKLASLSFGSNNVAYQLF